MTNANTVGREIVQIVEIQQPYCANTYGSAPCTASGAADAKCYNTFSTCQDQANFDKSSLSLYFSKGQVFNPPGALLLDDGDYLLLDDGGKLLLEGLGDDLPYTIPSLLSVSTAPTRINLAGANPDAQGLGNRAVVRIEFTDHPHTDRIVDPYLAGRSWDAYGRASFWANWIARNKYRANIPVKVYEGYTGQALADMTVRQYIMQSISRSANGRVSLMAMDILAKVEQRKAQAPVLSPGRLLEDITDAATSITVTNAATSDYSASGTIRIDDEVMTYSGVATSGDDIVFTISARGTDNTLADEHDADALVQECLRITDQAVDDIAATLLTDYAGIDAGSLDTAGWATEADTYLTGFLQINTLITEPMAVSELMAALQVECGCFFWWDERAALVKMKAVRGVDIEPDLLTDASHIIADTFSIAETPRSRISQMWIYYGRRDPTKPLSDLANFTYAQIEADLDAEEENEYGEKQVREIRAIFISSGAQALSTASKTVTRYRDTPRIATFEVDAKDRDYWTGSVVRISHHLDTDEFGENNIANWLVTQAEEVEPGHRVRLTCEDTTLYGRIYTIQAAGASDYQGDGTDPFNAAFIGDASGLLSDGTACARIG